MLKDRHGTTVKRPAIEPINLPIPLFAGSEPSMLGLLFIYLLKEIRLDSFYVVSSTFSRSPFSLPGHQWSRQMVVRCLNRSAKVGDLMP